MPSLTRDRPNDQKMSAFERKYDELDRELGTPETLLMLSEISPRGCCAESSVFPSAFAKPVGVKCIGRASQRRPVILLYPQRNGRVNREKSEERRVEKNQRRCRRTLCRICKSGLAPCHPLRRTAPSAAGTPKGQIELRSRLDLATTGLASGTSGGSHSPEDVILKAILTSGRCTESTFLRAELTPCPPPRRSCDRRYLDKKNEATTRIPGHNISSCRIERKNLD